VRISVSRQIDAPAERVWALVVDWERQSEWIPATTVRVLQGPHEGVGTRLEATTGAGPLRLADPMEVVEWDPPWLCVMRHEGRLLRGVGIFRTRPAAVGRCVFTWEEQLDPPGGRMGRLAAVVVGRLATPFFAFALRRLARLATRAPE
jgi:Polyketide cyclase / dehydrase and lipid transport